MATRRQERFNPNRLPGLFSWHDASRTATMTREAGMAAQFTAASSESLSIADNASLSMGDVVMDAFIWRKLDTLPGLAATMGLLGKWQAADQEYLLFVDNTLATVTFKFSVRDTGDTTTTTVTATTFGTPSTGTLYGIHIYHNPTTNEIGISVNDGAHDTAATSGGIRNGTAAFVLGSHTGGSYLNGSAQCDGVWKGVTNLTAAQITGLYNGGVPVAYADLDPVVRNSLGLQAYWELNEASGTRIDLADSNNLTDNNTVTTVAGNCLNAVGTWTDLSGNGRHAVQATQALKPVFRMNSIGGKPVVKFDGIDDYMTVDAAVGPTTPFSIYIVGKLTTATAAFKNVIGMSQNTAVKNWLYGFTNADSNATFLVLNTTGITSNAATFTDPQIILTQINLNSQTGLSEVRVSGNSKTGTQGTVTSDAVYFGARTLGGAFQLWADFQFAEVIIYNRLLNSMENRRIEYYLSRKWGINTI